MAAGTAMVAEYFEAAAAPQPIATNLYSALLASRPVACEVKAIERLADLMDGIPGAHVHIVHVTSAEGVAAIAAAQARGLRMTGESCPHYLLLHAELLEVLTAGNTVERAER